MQLTFICATCKTKKTVMCSPSRLKNKKYCSSYCQSHRRTSSVLHKCLLCNTEFRVEKHRLLTGRGKFCSKSCKLKYGHTDESKRKMSKQRLGKKTGRTGEKSHFWKGGVTEESKKIRMSLDIRNWRRAVFERDNHTCQICKKRGYKLNAHHIKPFSEFVEERFNVGNGITLCIKCHTGVHSEIKKLKKINSKIDYEKAIQYYKEKIEYGNLKDRADLPPFVSRM